MCYVIHYQNSHSVDSRMLEVILKKFPVIQTEAQRIAPCFAIERCFPNECILPCLVCGIHGGWEMDFDGFMNHSKTHDVQPEVIFRFLVAKVGFILCRYFVSDIAD